MVAKNEMVKILENRSLMSDLYEIQKKDIIKAASVIANAFSEDPMWKAIFNGVDKYYQAVSKMFIKFCMRYGNVVSTSDNLEGVMAITPYGKDMTVPRLIRSGAFLSSLKIAKVGKKMAQAMEVMEEAKESLNLSSYIYLNIIGVAQEFQGKGYGGKLLRAVVEKADIEREPIYLETQIEDNVTLYEKYGFHVAKKIILPELNLPMWLMVRDAK